MDNVPPLGSVPMAMLPLNTPSDIVDECIRLYRPNSLFRSFTITSSSDLTLIYGILLIQECLNKLKEGMNESEAGNLLNILASDRFAVMGEEGFRDTEFSVSPSQVI